MCSGVVHWHSQGALESGPACLFLRTWILSSIKGLSFLWLWNCPWRGRLETRKIVWCLVLTIRREGFFIISSGKVPMRRELALTFLWGTSRNLCSGTRHTTLRTFKTINILDKTFRNPSAFNPSRSAHVHPATFQIPSESSRTETLLKLSKVRCEKSSKHLHHCKKMQKAPKPSKLPQSPKVVQNPPRGWRSNTSEICLVSPEPLPPPGVCPFAHLWGLQPGSFSCTASNHPHLWALRSVGDLQFYTRSLLSKLHSKISFVGGMYSSSFIFALKCLWQRPKSGCVNDLWSGGPKQCRRGFLLVLCFWNWKLRLPYSKQLWPADLGTEDPCLDML